MMQAEAITIDETGLEELRKNDLNPERVLQYLDDHGTVVISAQPGVGKSKAVNSVQTSPATYDQYDLVVDFAPTKGIIAERWVVTDSSKSPVKFHVMEARPKILCGERDTEWTALERVGCSALAKAKLCTTCPLVESCSWLSRYTTEIPDAKLILAPEQHLSVNRSFLAMLKSVTGAKRMLVILDEATILDCTQTITISRRDLDQHLGALDDAAAQSPQVRKGTKRVRGLLRSFLRRGAPGDEASLSFSSETNRYSPEVQQAGLARYGATYRYIGYYLHLLQYSRPEEIYIDTDRSLRFRANLYIGADLLILSASLSTEYVRARLAYPENRKIHSPFASLRVKHSGTVFYNIKNGIGAAKNFAKNSPQILEFFAAKIRQNIAAGRSTVLVCKKSQRKLCVQSLTLMLRNPGGREPTILTDLRELPAQPDPHVIPIIHYGMLGINRFEEYNAAYCLSTYNVKQKVLEEQLSESERFLLSSRLETYLDEDRNRRVRVFQEPWKQQLEQQAELYLRRLEVDRAIQAASRVRPFTRPREVIFFQSNDLTPELGAHVVFKTLEEARQWFGISGEARKEQERTRRRIQLEEMISSGKSLRAAASGLGIPPSTAHRLLRQGKGVPLS